QDGTAIDLGTLGGSHAGASAVDVAGRVVGSSETATGDSHAFIWEAGVGMRDLGTLGGRFSGAYAIADGQVIGWSSTGGDADDNHAFLWRDGVMTDLGTLGGRWANAFDINAAGDIVGSAAAASGEEHAVLWTTRSTPALLDDLVAFGKTLAIPKELTAKLTSAAASLAAGDTLQVCSAVTSFIHMANARSGKVILASQASQLTAASSNIARLVGCR
ncbi:MAG TPA: hypothetical protein VFP65_21060, partial [Anaeromyxobacteraceae bacterium]|nr:hypothetical protein [Anaeromyxobacteraceae bacterium]